MSSVALSNSLIRTGLILCLAVHKAVEISQGDDFVEIVMYDARQHLRLQNKEEETVSASPSLLVRLAEFRT